MEPLTIQSERMLFGCDDLQGTCTHPGLPDWGGDVYREFLAAILDKKFPCTFAALGLSERLCRFAFASDPRAPRCADELAAAIAEYFDWLPTVPPEKDIYAVLIVCCAPIEEIEEESYRRIFEKLLREVNLRDPAPWPAQVPKQADKTKFTFCFGGREIFVNANTPSQPPHAWLHRGVVHLWPQAARLRALGAHWRITPPLASRTSSTAFPRFSDNPLT